MGAAARRMRGEGAVSRTDTDPREPVPCRYCEDLILWAKNSRSGKMMPFDVEPDPALKKGWALLWRPTINQLIATYTAKHDPRLRFRHPHFETCPNYKPKAHSDSAEPQQQSLIERDRLAETRAALPPGYMEHFGR